MPKSESLLTKYFVKELQRVNAEVFVLSASLRQSRGIPDRFVSHSLWCGFVEFKREGGGKISGAQSHFTVAANKDGELKSVIVQFKPNLVWAYDEWLEFDGTPLHLLRVLHEKRKTTREAAC